MNTSDKGSITHWLEGLKAGDSIAAQGLWDEYFSQLVAVARSRLKHREQDVAGEDVALSALKSVMIGVRENRFPDLADRTGLWPLLVTITARKSIDEVRRQQAAKRPPLAALQPEELQQVIGQSPSPEFAVEVAEQMERLVSRHDDETLRTIAQMKLEGYTHEEIAKRLGCSKRTVIRKLERIRQEWEETP